MGEIIKINGHPGFTVKGNDGENGKRGFMTFFPETLSEESRNSIRIETVIDGVTREKIIKKIDSANTGDFLITDIGYMKRCLKITRIENNRIIAECVGTWNPDPENGIGIEISYKSIPYNKISGYETDDNGDMYLKTETETKTYISFHIFSDSENVPVGNIRIEAEFICKSYNGAMPSIRPWLWETTNYDYPNRLYPFGFAENMSYKTNFDNEDMGTFIAIIKDFNEHSNETEFESDVLIRNTDLENYDIKLYVYTHSGETALHKRYIGTIEN